MVTKELIEKYHLGLCSPEEKKAVEAWLNSAEHQVDLTPEKDDEQVRQQIWQALRPTITQTREVRNIPLYKRLMRYAAAAIILCTLGISAYYFLGNSTLERSHEIISFDDYKPISTQRGEKRTVTLSDGSTIRMNYETEIRAPQQFEGSERIVYLTGHAHFNIAHNPEKPFIIYTEDTKTQVLGTSFDVRTFPNSEKTEVVVSSGKVEFSSKEDTQNKVLLTVNDRALLLPGEKISVSEVFAADYTAWKDNRLVFEDASLEEIVLVLERWYDIDITVRNTKLLGNRYTFAYDNPPLPTLLERMSFVAKFEYTIEGKQVTIY
ncbi:MAG: FecR domain-containing protein [Bacteroidota bacterium]